MKDKRPKVRNDTRSPTRLIISKLDDSGVALRKAYTARNDSRLWRNFRTSLESVPEALQSQNQKLLPLADLAKLLGVDAKRLLPALEYGYLKLVSADPPLVYEPPPAAIEWLRMMFQPIVMRPFLSSEMVAQLEGVSTNSVRRLCLDYGIPIYSDPVFGELMSIASFYRFHEQMHHQRAPSRFDRQAILAALMHTVRPDEWRIDIKAPKFSRRFELEVRRIAGLKEPARTDAALRLWEAYRDGKKVAQCITAARGVKIEDPKTMTQLRRILEVELPPESSPLQTPSQG